MDALADHMQHYKDADFHETRRRQKMEDLIGLGDERGDWVLMVDRVEMGDECLAAKREVKFRWVWK